MNRKFFYDTEFHDFGGGRTELISVGMVDEDGHEYYAISHEFNWELAWNNTWLRENVLSHLPTVVTEDGRTVLDRDHPDVASREQIRADLEEFTHPGDDADPETKVELWAYCSGYDHVVLSGLWGPLINSPAWWPYSSNDTRQEHERLRGSVLPKQQSGEHNALSDARHTRAQYEVLKSYERVMLFEVVKMVAGGHQDLLKLVSVPHGGIHMLHEVLQTNIFEVTGDWQGHVEEFTALYDFYATRAIG